MNVKNYKHNWKDITLIDYLTIQQIQKDNEKNHEQAVKMIIQYLYEIDIDDEPIMKVPQILNRIKFLNEELPKEKLKNEYEINGNKYELNIIPQNFTYSQFMDFSLFNNNENENKIIDLLSVVLIPKEHKYNDGYDMEAVKKDIEDLPFISANAICSFFLNLSKNYIQVLTYFLQKILKKTKMKTETREILTAQIQQLIALYHLQSPQVR